MKAIKVKLDRTLKKVKIITLADLHIGDKDCDMELVKELINKVKQKDYYCILNGDILDNAIMDSVGNTYDETYNPIEQLEIAIELLKPIKDKILCITCGNHEERTNRKVRIDLAYLIAQSLGLKDRYCEDGSGVVFLSLGELKSTKETNGSGNARQVAYSIFVSHGCKGGSTLGGKVNALKSYENIVTNCDVYIGSHTHQASIFPTTTFEVDTRNKSIYRRNKLFLSNGSTLNYGGYAEKANYQPNAMVYPTLELNGTVKLMSANIEL